MARLIGKNFTPPDVQAKVTGKAKYSEDFSVEVMVFCRLLLSPVPHGKVRNIELPRLSGRATRREGHWRNERLRFADRP